MNVRRAYRYELDPNREQRILLAKHAGAARFAYNWGLARRIELYQQTGKSTNAIEQHRDVNAARNLLAWPVRPGQLPPVRREVTPVDIGGCRLRPVPVDEAGSNRGRCDETFVHEL